MAKNKDRGTLVQQRFKNVRLFMRSGAVFTIAYLTESQDNGGKVTTYKGVGDVFLADVRNEEVAAKVSMDLPFTLKEVPQSDQPGAPLVKVQVPTAGSVIVTGYKF
jgi:hypothetical protein